MSSIASGMNAERTNRWLLIGAAVLALGAAVLVFLLLANVGGDGDGGTVAGTGEEVTVYVASQTIPANTRITSSMVEAVTVRESQAVADYASAESSVVDKVTTAEIIEGNQISLAQVGGSSVNDIDETGLAPALDTGRVAFALSADEISNVAGFVQAGDYVNVVGVFKIEPDQADGVTGAVVDDQVAFTRVETLLQNVEVLAVAQASVDVAPAASSTDGETTTDGETADPDTARVRPDEVEPNPDAGSVTVHLTPQDAQLLAAARAEGEIFLELRALGDAAVQEVTQTCFDTFGSFPCPAPVRRFQ